MEEDAVKVGIGTSAPVYDLEVNGTIAARKILIANDNETQDLLALILALKDEVKELKQQLMAAK